jgi:glycerol uptake facilitator protein
LTGFALNPARDFGPKLFAYFAGWGKVAFTGARDIPYFLVPIFGPLIGASLGAVGYKTLVGRHLPYEINEEAEEKAAQQASKQRKA